MIRGGHNLAALAAACLSFAGGFAQAQSFDFRVMSVGDGNYRDILYIPEPNDDPEEPPETEEVRFAYMDRSSTVYRYEGGDPLVFYRDTGRKDERGFPILVPVAQTRVSGSSEDQLLIFTAADARSKADGDRQMGSDLGLTGSSPSEAEIEFEPEFRILRMDDGARGFPDEHIIFLNGTPVTLYMKFGERNILLDPGLNGPFKIAEYMDKPVFVGMIVRWRDGAKVVLKNRWEFSPGYRNIMLILPPDRRSGGKVKVFRISEHVAENRKFNSSFVELEGDEVEDEL